MHNFKINGGLLAIKFKIRGEEINPTNDLKR